MNIVQRNVKLLTATPYEVALNIVETAGRTCYKSEDKMKEGSAEGLIRGLIKSGHFSVIEFFDVTFKIVCDRQTSHQLVRHRLCSVAQTSQRYVNYANNKWNNSVPFIVPCNMTNELYDTWRASCLTSESAYFVMLDKGAKPELARSVLPNCVATELCMKMNMRELRHFLKLRLDTHAQDDIRDIAYQMLDLIYNKYPIFVEDIVYNNKVEYIKWLFNLKDHEPFKFYAKNYMLLGDNIDNEELNWAIKNYTFTYINEIKGVLCCETPISETLIDKLLDAVLKDDLYISTPSACMD